MTEPERCDSEACPHVMQVRCIHCKREQYALAVWLISHGLLGCSWCGELPPVFTDENHYRAALRAD